MANRSSCATPPSCPDCTANLGNADFLDALQQAGSAYSGLDCPTLSAQPPPDPALAARVQDKFGERCKLERSCGELLGVDCGAAVDGPYYYVQKSDLKTVATCGGACMGGRCTDCPPKAWTCATY